MTDREWVLDVIVSELESWMLRIDREDNRHPSDADLARSRETMRAHLDATLSHDESAARNVRELGEERIRAAARGMGEENYRTWMAPRRPS